MANTFKNKGVAIGTSATDFYQVPAGVTSSVTVSYTHMKLPTKA